ncbi:MAG: phospholipase D-like domain-containing protein, partial [Planctomycetota bacterium]|nr:phospholipase D-like domain-containing protein [Planctomycetota bacterium]
MTAALLQAADRSVRVYLLTASALQIKKWLEHEGSSGGGQLERHTDLLDRMAGRVLVRSSDMFHAKFLLVDPDREETGSVSQGSAFLSTANLNPALTKSIDLGIELSPDDAYSLFGAFRTAFWDLSTHELFEPGTMKAIVDKPGSPPERSAGSLRFTLGDHTDLKTEILELIRTAANQLLVSAYTLKADHETVQSLADASKRGVEVKVLMRKLPSNAGAASFLAKAGAQIRAHDSLHAKAVVSDGKAIVMTANLDPLGMDRGFEIGCLLPEIRASRIHQTLQEWFEGFPWEYSIEPRLGDHIGEVSIPSSSNGVATGFIEAETSIQIEEPLTADSVLLMDKVEPANLNQIARSKWAHRVQLDWQVLPPSLPEGAKKLERSVPRDQPYRRPVFEKDGHYFVKGNKKDKRSKKLVSRPRSSCPFLGSLSSSILPV